MISSGARGRGQKGIASRTGRAGDGVPSLGAPVEFLRLVWAVDHALQSASKRMARALGVTGPQRLVIRIVGRRPGISPGALAEILHLHPSTLTGVLKRLMTAGAIEKVVDPEDGRRTLLSLTAKGRAIDRGREGTVEAAVRRTLTSLRDSEVRSAARVLRRLAASLGRQMRAWSA